MRPILFANPESWWSQLASVTLVNFLLTNPREGDDPLLVYPCWTPDRLQKTPCPLFRIWNALNGPEPETGNNHLRDLLCVHNAIPSPHFGKKLMHLMKFGP